MQGKLDGAPNLGRVDDHRLGQAGREVSTPHPLVDLLAQGKGRPGRDLDVLGRAFTEEQGVFALHVSNDRLVDLVAADPHRSRRHDPAEADDRDIRRAATDVDDHRGSRLVDGKARAEGCSHRLLDDVDPPSAGPQRRILERAPLDTRDVARHPHHDARTKDRGRRDLVDEPAQHALAHLRIGDDAIAQGADRGDRARCSTHHFLGSGARREQVGSAGAHRHDRRLVEDHSAAPLVDHRVGGPQVDGEVTTPESTPHARHPPMLTGGSDREPGARGIPVKGIGRQAAVIRAPGTRCRSPGRRTRASRSHGRCSSGPSRPSRARGRRGCCPARPRSGWWRRRATGSP